VHEQKQSNIHDFIMSTTVYGLWCYVIIYIVSLVIFERRKFVDPFSVVGENQMIFRILSNCLEKNTHFKLIY